jgi:hypothetical protein
MSGHGLLCDYLNGRCFPFVGMYCPRITPLSTKLSQIDMTSLSIRNVAVLGAGGSLGPTVLEFLDHHFVVTIITRESSTSTFPSKFKTHVVPDDYATAQLLPAFTGQDAVVSLVSPWACQIQKHIIDVAVKAGVKRFIPAEFGYDTTNANAVALLPALQIRVDIVEYLRTQERNGLTWTALITGPFFDWGLANGFTGFDLPNHKAMIYDDGDQHFSTSTVPLIANAVAKILLQPDATLNRYVYISSFTTTQNKILAMLEKYSSVQWEVARVSSKAKIEEAREAFKNGEEVAAASRLLILAVQYTAGNGSDFTGRDSNEDLGLPRENMDDIVKRALEAK